MFSFSCVSAEFLVISQCSKVVKVSLTCRLHQCYCFPFCVPTTQTEDRFLLRCNSLRQRDCDRLPSSDHAIDTMELYSDTHNKFRTFGCSCRRLLFFSVYNVLEELSSAEHKIMQIPYHHTQPRHECLAVRSWMMFVLCLLAHTKGKPTQQGQ